MNMSKQVESIFDELEKLPAGWDGYDALPVNKKTLNIARRAVSAIIDCHPNLIMPDVGAVEDGRVDIVIMPPYGRVFWATLDVDELRVQSEPIVDIPLVGSDDEKVATVINAFDGFSSQSWSKN